MLNGNAALIVLGQNGFVHWRCCCFIMAIVVVVVIEANVLALGVLAV
jgi:hypothetical protein